MGKKEIFMSLLFNIVEIIAVILFGFVLGVKLPVSIMLLLIFFITRFYCKQPKHYNKWYRCFIWSLLIFESLFLIVRIDLKLSIIFAIFMAYILSGKADINDMFMWKGKTSKYQALKDIVSLSPNNPIILDYENYWRVNNPLRYELFILFYRENKSYNEICEIKDLDPDNTRIIQNECKSIYEQLERPLNLPLINE